MILEFSVTKLNSDGKAEGAKERFRFSKQDILIGPDDAADIKLEIEQNVLKISATEELITIQPLNEQKVSLNHDSISAQTKLKNGDHIEIDGYLIRFYIHFDKVKLINRSKLGPRVIGFIIILILVIEIGVISWLPKYLSKQEIWTREFALQGLSWEVTHLENSLRNLDKLRVQFTKHNPETADLRIVSLQLIDGEVRKLHKYVDLNRDQLSQRQIVYVMDKIVELKEWRGQIVGNKVYNNNNQIKEHETLKKIIEGD